MNDVAVALLAYLIGSIPTGVLIGNLKGTDVRRVGSGNIGATNVARAAGRAAGIVTLLGDTAKGAVAVVLARALATRPGTVYVAALAVVLGHTCSVFLRLRGGKGVATALGVGLALAPAAMILPLGVFAVVAATTRVVSVASLAGAFATPLSMALLGTGRGNVLLTLAVAVLIAVRHRDNIQRLRKGTEFRFGRRETPDG
jgi:glycerol-3-phosphate acyltransferase PlsY